MSRGRLTRRSLTEFVQSPPRRVDREKGIIYGVKVIGLESKNGRRYLPEAVQNAAPLYSVACCYENHPDKPNAPRKLAEKFGWLESYDPATATADLHLLLTHPRAATVLEAAEKKPDLFGMSHNAEGEGTTDADGTFVVHRITEVRSVDVVCEPATTSSFFEHHQRTQPMKRIKAREFFKGLESRIDVAKRARVKKIVEDMGQAGDVMIPEEPEEDAGDYKADLLAAVAKLLDSDDEESQGMVTKIMGLLKPKKAAPATEDDETDTSESEDEEDDDGKKGKKDTEESLKREAAVNRLCRAAKFTPSEPLFEALCALNDDAKRKTLIAESKAAGGKGGRQTPRSQSPGADDAGNGGNSESLTEQAIPTKTEELTEWLRGG